MLLNEINVNFPICTDFLHHVIDFTFGLPACLLACLPACLPACYTQTDRQTDRH
jgi:hypothetical protein